MEKTPKADYTGKHEFTVAELVSKVVVSKGADDLLVAELDKHIVSAQIVQK